MMRPRACGALIYGDMILMVRHAEQTRSYWTLPGGGVEAGETPAEAAVREVRKERGLQVRAVRLLWEGTNGIGIKRSPEYCYLVEPEAESEDKQAIVLGHDPEEAHLPFHQQLLQGVAWVPLAELVGDAQVARVLMALEDEAVL